MVLRTLLLFLVLFSTHSEAQNTCTDRRYVDDIFDVDLSGNHDVFGQAPAVAGSFPCQFYTAETITCNQTFRYDLYQPVGDTLTKRPLIVMAFGGAFLVGFKEFGPLRDYCNAMTRKGFVVASIDYRLGFNALNQNSAVRGVYRAGQDMKAALRYFKLNAQTLNIDTNYIFSGGHSAGSIAAMHANYVEESDRASHPMFVPTYGGGIGNSWPDLGCGECSGNTFPFKGDSKAIINMWGAIGDPAWIDSPTQQPIISFHGEDDDIVKIDSGAPFSVDALFPVLHGSSVIHAQALSVGLESEFYSFPGENHEPWTNPAVADFMVEKSADFLYRYMQPDQPVLIGTATVCGSSTETYSVTHTPGSTYCWIVDGGTQVSSSSDGSSIDVLWDASGTGSIEVLEISRNVAESDWETLAISITQIVTPSTLIISANDAGTADLSWVNEPGLDYEVQFSEIGSGVWSSSMASASPFVLNGLSSCKDYSIRVRAVCSPSYVSTFSTTAAINTDEAIVQVKAFLEGAMDGSTMRSDLYQDQLLPLGQPFNGAPWNYSGSENVISHANFPSNTVDWVLLELIDPVSSTVEFRKAALLLDNGDVVDPDGITNGLVMCNVKNNNPYHLVLRHRNHLAVMSSTSISFGNTTVFDFSSGLSQASSVGLGHNSLVAHSSGVFVLPAGDNDGNGRILVPDTNLYYSESSGINSYLDSDLNLDGQVTVRDFNLHQNNIGKLAISDLRY